MPTLPCRDCGSPIDTEARAGRCRSCGTLLPLACSVCGKGLRPPLPVQTDERYLTTAGQPLCADHFERLCPECHGWFRADENPGYFLCPACTAARATLPPAVVVAPPAAAEPEPESPSITIVLVLGTVIIVVLIFLILLLFNTGT